MGSTVVDHLSPDIKVEGLNLAAAGTGRDKGAEKRLALKNLFCKKK